MQKFELEKDEAQRIYDRLKKNLNVREYYIPICPVCGDFGIGGEVGCENYEFSQDCQSCGNWYTLSECRDENLVKTYCEFVK